MSESVKAFITRELQEKPYIRVRSLGNEYVRQVARPITQGDRISIGLKISHFLRKLEKEGIVRKETEFKSDNNLYKVMEPSRLRLFMRGR